MHRLIATAFLTTALCLSAVTSAAPGSAAPTGVEAVAQWSMVPLAKDADGDGFIDGDGGVPRRGALSRQPSTRMVGAGNHRAQPHERLIDGTLSWYLSPAGFPVRLDACRSRGSRYRWTISQGGTPVRSTTWRPTTKGTCQQTVLLPEGSYDLALEVRSGSRTDIATTTADVRNILMVALGDSYASGEGNPRNVDAWLREGAPFAPYWDDDACNRSTRGSPAQAALALEESSRTTSVLLVDVACSGATVTQGVLGPQVDAGQARSQIEQVRSIVGDRPADIVTISVGGNDIGFGSILQSCALNSDCPLARPSSGVLSGFPTVQTGVQATTAGLAASYGRIATCIGAGTCTLSTGRVVPSLRLATGGAVLPTAYPDITRAADGRPCTYFTIGAPDFAWAGATILSPTPAPTYAYPLSDGGVASLSIANGSLNGQVAAAGALPGWRPVLGTWAASGQSATGHGVCAGDDAWVYGATSFSGFTSASFHPNPPGQAAAGAALLAALRSVVG